MGDFKSYPVIQGRMTSAAFSTFGAKSKIALTGVCSRDRESLAKRLVYYF